MTFTRSDLADLNVFAVVARNRSFRRAGAVLGLSTSALSHALRNLEGRLGVRLINRSNRSVAPTHAGEALLERLELGFAHIEDALEDLNRFRETPIGRLRLNVPRDAVDLLIRPVLPQYMAAHPDMEVEITVDDDLVDIVAGGYDAGVRQGGAVAEDMIAMSVGPPLRWIVVGAPGYLRRNGVPAVPEDIRQHACIRLRCHDAIYKWEFEKDGQTRAVDTPGSLIVNNGDLAVKAAEDGLGLAYCIEAQVAEQLRDGRLQLVLAEWCKPGPGFQLYYPSRRQVPAGLRAFIDMIRQHYATARREPAAIAA
jgi:DNA-binding transcriptional LysR family regulator